MVYYIAKVGQIIRKKMKKTIFIFLAVASISQKCWSENLDHLFAEEGHGHALIIDVQAEPKKETISVLDMPALAVGYVYYTLVKPKLKWLAYALLAVEKKKARRIKN